MGRGGRVWWTCVGRGGRVWHGGRVWSVLVVGGAW